MKWEGKAIGGVLGAAVGGPIGAGVGAVVGHLLADRPSEKLIFHRIIYEHHHFGPQGPSLKVVPGWEAQGLEGAEVRVRLSSAGQHWEEIVEPEAPKERCEIPVFLVPYMIFEDEDAEVSLRIRLSTKALDPVQQSVKLELPTSLRRQSNAGPARQVMALVAAIRAKEALQQESVRWIRTQFTAAYALDETGMDWLKGWLKQLRDLDIHRLSAAKVAERVGSSLELGEQERLLIWLVLSPWTDPIWIDAFAQGLGLEAPWPESSALPRTRLGAAALLGLPLDSPLEQIRAAWRAQVSAEHPDRAENSERATRITARLNAAWELLRQGTAD